MDTDYTEAETMVNDVNALINKWVESGMSEAEIIGMFEIIKSAMLRRAQDSAEIAVYGQH